MFHCIHGNGHMTSVVIHPQEMQKKESCSHLPYPLNKLLKQYFIAMATARCGDWLLWIFVRLVAMEINKKEWIRLIAMEILQRLVAMETSSCGDSLLLIFLRLFAMEIKKREL